RARAALARAAGAVRARRRSRRRRRVARAARLRARRADLEPARVGRRVARRCTVLQLRRLSREDAGALVKDLAPSSDAGVADTLFEATSGNPLFLCETARALADRRFTGALPVGQGVGLVVRGRVSALSAPARALVEYGAVL